MRKQFLIGEVANLTGVSIKTLQRWSDKKYVEEAETTDEKKQKEMQIKIKDYLKYIQMIEVTDTTQIKILKKYY